MIVKVKEPVPEEYPRLKAGQIVFSYLHLAPLPDLTQVLLDKKVVGVAYETISDRARHLAAADPDERDRRPDVGDRWILLSSKTPRRKGSSARRRAG